jgi:hypothetical protein
MSEKNKKGGPNTPEGKAISSQNSLRHGLASSQILIAGEDPEAFESLLDELEKDHKPKTATEVLLVHDLAKFHWLKNRAIRLQQAAFDNPEAIDFKRLELMMRYQNANVRAFNAALKSLQAAQKERERQYKEFVSQDNPEMIPGTDLAWEEYQERHKDDVEEEEEVRIFLRPPGKLA